MSPKLSQSTKVSSKPLKRVTRECWVAYDVEFFGFELGRVSGEFFGVELEEA